MPNSSSHLTRYLAPLPILMAALLACGCSGKSATDDPSIASSDALTSDEEAAGESWNADDEEDFFTPEEEAAMSTEGPLITDSGDATDDGSSGDVQTATFRRHDCDRQTGYNHGKMMSVCTVPIDGKDVEESTAAAYEKMRAAAADAGIGLVVVSGFRTMAKQRELYAMYKNHTGNLAAPPGYSNHQSGHAVDLNTEAPGVYSWLQAHGATFGFRRTVPSEKWHYEHW